MSPKASRAQKPDKGNWMSISIYLLLPPGSPHHHGQPHMASHPGIWTAHAHLTLCATACPLRRCIRLAPVVCVIDPAVSSVPPTPQMPAARCLSKAQAVQTGLRNSGDWMDRERAACQGEGAPAPGGAPIDRHSQTCWKTGRDSGF